MPRPELTRKAQAEMERAWELRREAVRLLDLIVAEWKSDPSTVKGFDLRIVNRAGEVVAELKKLDPFNDL